MGSGGSWLGSDGYILEYSSSVFSRLFAAAGCPATCWCQVVENGVVTCPFANTGDLTAHTSLALSRLLFLHFPAFLLTSPLCAADPQDEEMYVAVGKTKTGLTKWRCTRGSSKNEAANLVIERSLHTTAKLTELTAGGGCQGRVLSALSVKGACVEHAGVVSGWPSPWLAGWLLC